MRRIAIVVTLLVTAGCSTTQDARTALDRIEFDADEVGCARISGTIDIGGVMGFGATSASMVVVKRKATYTDASGETLTASDVPEC